MKNFSDYRLLPLIFSLVLTACGGGGGGGGNTFNPVPTAPPANSAPSANAGADQQVLASEEVNLSGSGSDSDGSIASYLWTQTSGETVTLGSDDTASTSFTAPAVETRLEFELRVTDDDGAEATDSVSVSVSLPANNSPTADAGVNQTVAISSQVILNGTATDSDGSIANYSWAQTSGETVSLTDADTATATFTTPDIGGLLEFSLTVADNQGATATDSVTINVSDEKVSVSGFITFDLVPFAASRIGLDYSNIQQAPARGLVVEAVDESSNVLLSTLTDSQGRYDLRVDSNTSMRVRVLAKLLQTTGVTWDVKVTDNTLSNALYAVQGDLFNAGSTDSNINFNMPSGWDGSSYSSSRTAAPFAILGSIGVVAQLPNFHRLLKKNEIDVEMHTAGEYKRTLTFFGENTEKAREKFQADLDDVHVLFKEFVSTNRPIVDIDQVSTGEYWFGQRALALQLTDRLCTSDAFLQSHAEHSDLVEVRYRAKRGWQERIGVAAELAVERGFRRLLRSEQDQRFL